MQEDTTSDTPKRLLHALLFGQGEDAWVKAKSVDVTSGRQDDCRRISITPSAEDYAPLLHELNMLMSSKLIPVMRLSTMNQPTITIQVDDDMYRAYVRPLIAKEQGVRLLPEGRMVTPNNAAAALEAKLKAALLQRGWSAWQEKSDKFEHYYTLLLPLRALAVSPNDDLSETLQTLRKEVPGLGSLRQSLMISSSNMAKFTITPSDFKILQQHVGKHHAGRLYDNISVLGLGGTKPGRSR